MSVPPSSSDETEAILGNIKEDGSFDRLRQQLVLLVKASPGFQEQVRKQMVDSDLRRSSTVDVVDGRHMMEQLRSNADHNNALRELVLKEIWRLLDGEPGISGALDNRVQEALIAVTEDRERECAEQFLVAGRRAVSGPMAPSQTPGSVSRQEPRAQAGRSC